MNKRIREINIEKIRYAITDNLLFIGIWSLAFLTVLTFNFQKQISLSFVGVTDSKEVNINLKHAILIKKIHVLPGQLVSKGQLIAELERPDLIKQINDVSHRLEELRSQLTLNEKLNSSLKSIKQSNKDIDNSLTIQIRSLENQLTFLKQEQQELFVFAMFDGHIGFVNYKSGESVSPFAPIMTMHQKTPTFVRGYVHESIMNKIHVGSFVEISSLNSEKVMRAQVTSVGTRIIEFPERFRRSIDEKIWGREVGIKLSANNEFLLGEKVFLEVKNNENTTQRSLANGNNDYADNVEYIELKTPRSIRDLNRIEPSGLTFVPDLNKFLLISDDTFKDQPFVFLLNPDGQFDQRILKIDGLKDIKDMEAITSDENDNLYVVSSLAKSRNGKVSKARRRIVKFQRKGLELLEDKKTDLLKVLNELAIFDPSQDWVQLLQKKNLIESKFQIELDIEGLAVKNDKIYLGLRRTTTASGELIVLEIDNATEMFESDQLRPGQVSIFKKIKIPTPNQGISDLFIYDEMLYFLTADNGPLQRGGLYRVAMDIDSNEGLLLKTFEGRRPEGLAIDPQSSFAYVVFDNNKSKKSYMTKVKI